MVEGGPGIPGRSVGGVMDREAETERARDAEHSADHRHLAGRPGHNDPARLAAVNPLASFQSRRGRPRWRGSPTFGTVEAVFSTIFAAAISATRPAVPKMRLNSRVRTSYATTSMTDAAADALDAMNITGTQRRAACQIGIAELDTRTPVYPARAAPKIPER